MALLGSVLPKVGEQSPLASLSKEDVALLQLSRPQLKKFEVDTKNKFVLLFYFLPIEILQQSLVSENVFFPSLLPSPQRANTKALDVHVKSRADSASSNPSGNPY